MKNLLHSLIFLTTLIPALVMAQGTDPINSNYLIEHGVSPRILDAAASQLLQDGSYVQDIIIESDKEGENSTYKLQVIYDPSYEDGMDVRMVYEGDKLDKKEKKWLHGLVEKSHHFSRMSRKYLYDESTLKLVKNEGGEVVFEYYYQKQDIEPYLKHIKRLKGNIFFVDGKLDRVELTNTKKLKGNVIKMHSIVRYEKTTEDGGYIVTSIVEDWEQKKGKEIHKYSISAETSDYTNANGEFLTWLGKESISPMFINVPTDTVSVKLGWALPLLGKPATKLGYSLPRAIGLNVFTHFQDQTMQFTGISIGKSEDDLVSLNEAFNLDESTIRASGYVAMVKADVWVFPFLNVMGIAGKGSNTIEGNWPLDDDLKKAIEEIGWIIGIDPEDIPDGIELNGNLDANMAGLGVTLAGGVGDWNVSLVYQFMATMTPEANTTTLAHVVMPMVGYMLPFGMNVMAGAQGQFYDTKVTGNIELDSENTLYYNVDFQPVHWNAMLGIYKGFAKHWEIALQAGFGNRKSVTAVFGYRF